MFHHNNHARQPNLVLGSRLRLLVLALITASVLLTTIARRNAAHAQSGTPVTTVSAASYETTAVAPGAIVAAFGASLATATQVSSGLPLPTSLAGTTVRVKDSGGAERLAGLFFVSSGQVNYLLPVESAAGVATVTIQSGNGVTSQGNVTIKSVAPAVFSANSDGAGVPAAVVLRVKSNGAQSFEALSQFDSSTGRYKPTPINLGPEGERVFLILFLSGIRRASDPNNDGNTRETIHLILGGNELTPDYAGVQGTLAGLDQMNIELPRSLIGRGRVTLSVTGAGATSNTGEIDIAPASGTAPPSISGFSSPTVLAGQSLNIQGNGFTSPATSNLVRMSGVEATVTSGSSTQLSVVVPYGAESGSVSVRTNLGEGASATPLAVRTSISGIVETTAREPIPGVKLTVRGTSITDTTDAEGTFLLPDVPGGLAFVDIDGASAQTALPYPAVVVKKQVTASRDNPFDQPVALQQATGPGIDVGQSGGFAAETAATEGSIQTNGVIFEVPDNATARFPNGATRGRLFLTLVENSRLPEQLPIGHFSSRIVQITPFGVRLTPGGKLTFPNPDGYAPGTKAMLFRFDQTPNSPNIGGFVVAGTATVSNDGMRIETEPGAVTETSYYFVSVLRPTTTVIGRVVDSDGVTPVRFSLVRARGREAFTDGNGGFILRDVPANNASDLLNVEASYARPGGRVDRAQRTNVAPVINGLTVISPAIVLPSPATNRAPVVLAPDNLVVTQGETRDVNILVNDPDPNQTLTVQSSVGQSFARILSTTSRGLYLLRVTPSADNGGDYTLSISASDGLTTTIERVSLRVNRPPTATAQNVTTAAGSARSFSLSGKDPDADPLQYIVTSQPASGKLSGTPPDLTYTPNAGFSGTDRFVFKVNDGYVDSASTAVAIQVLGATANLLRNGGAEDGQLSSSSTQVLPLTGWTTTSNFMALVYGLTGFMSTAEGQRVNGSKGYFVGGPNNATSTATQTVSVANFVTDIDAGRRDAVLQAYLSGFEQDTATARADFINAAGAILGTITIGPVTNSRATFQLRQAVGTIPPGTRSIRVTLQSSRGSTDAYNDGYFENVFLGIGPN